MRTNLNLVLMNKEFDPPITVCNAAVYTIDNSKNSISIVFYITNNQTITECNPANDPVLKKELENRLEYVLMYLFKEGFINPSSDITKWNAVSGLVVGKIPNFE